MLFLKQSTASQTVLIGPFVDSTDGVTAETGLTIANTDIRLSKNGANIAAKNSGGGTHDENGWYQITLDATDTNTVGKLQLHCVMSGALPVWHEYYVLEEDIFEAMFASGAAAFNSSDQVAVGSIAANAITATAIASNAITAAKIAADTIGASELAADAASEIATAVWAAVTRTLTAGTNLNDLSAAQVNAEVDAAIETYHLDHLLAADYDPASKPGVSTALLNELIESDAGVSRFTANALEQAPTGGSAPTAADIADAVWDEAKSGHVGAGSFGEEVQAHALSSEVSAVETDTQDIQSRLPAALVSGRMSSDVVAISGSTTAADNLEASTLGIIVGQAQTGTLSTTQMTTNLSGYDDDRLIGATIVFTGSPLAGERTNITDYANSSGLLTFTAVTEAPTNGTTFVIV